MPAAGGTGVVTIVTPLDANFSDRAGTLQENGFQVEPMQI